MVGPKGSQHGQHSCGGTIYCHGEFDWQGEQTAFLLICDGCQNTLQRDEIDFTITITKKDLE